MLCIGCLGQWAQLRRKNSNMVEIFSTSPYLIQEYDPNTGHRHHSDTETGPPLTAMEKCLDVHEIRGLDSSDSSRGREA